MEEHVVPEELSDLVAWCADEPRVYGVALLLPERETWTRLVIATTWDGLESIGAELPAIAGRTRSLDCGACLSDHDGTRWRGLDAEGRRLELEALRIGDLTPEVGRHDARALLDRQGLIEQWARWRRGRMEASDDPCEAEVATRVAAARVHRALSLDDALRSIDDLPRGTRRVQVRGRTHPFRHEIGERLRTVAGRLDASDPVEAGLARRVLDATRDIPLAGEGALVDAGTDEAEARGRFYAVADGEGFRGDRPLFEAARERLAALAKCEPAFSQGFVLPTFDAVEVRFELGEAIGGCKPPLIPGVVVGVGVTPADALEVWAAACVREPTCGTACVADTGARNVLSRDVGLDGIVEALSAAVEDAHDQLAELIRAARDAAQETVGDAPAALAALHLPRSFVAGIRIGGARPLSATRLALALATARAGEDGPPLVARKLGLAAGRLLLG